MKTIAEKGPTLLFSFPKRGIYISLTFVLAFVMVVFLTSSLWLHTTTSAEHTPIGTTIKIGISTVTLKSWRYNPENHTMLVDFGTKDFNVEKDVSYGLGVYDDMGNPINADIAYFTDFCLMLKIEDVPKTSFVTIQVSLKEFVSDEGDSEEGATTQKPTAHFTGLLSELDTNDTLILDMSDTEYTLFDIESDIGLYERQLLELQNAIEHQAQIIQNAEDKIESIRADKDLMTEEEKDAADEQIEILKQNISLAQNIISNTSESIADLEQKIAQKLEIVDAFRAKNGI